MNIKALLPATRVLAAVCVLGASNDIAPNQPAKTSASIRAEASQKGIEYGT
jgi:hypothetical protein